MRLLIKVAFLWSLLVGVAFAQGEVGKAPGVSGAIPPGITQPFNGNGPVPPFCKDPKTAPNQMYYSGIGCPNATATFTAPNQFLLFDGLTFQPVTFVNGTNTTVAYNSGAGTFQINATGGGGSGTVATSVASYEALYTATTTVTGFPQKCVNIMGPGPWGASGAKCDGSTDDFQIFDTARQTGGAYCIPPGTALAPRICNVSALDLGAAALNNSYCTASHQPSWCCSGSGTGTCGITSNSSCTAAGLPAPCCTGSGTGTCSTSTSYNKSIDLYGGNVNATQINVTVANNTTATAVSNNVATGGAVQILNTDGVIIDGIAIHNEATYNGNAPTGTSATYSTLPVTCFLLAGNQPTNDALTLRNVDLQNDAATASGIYNPIAFCPWSGINRQELDHVHLIGGWGMGIYGQNSANQVQYTFVVPHANYSNLATGITFDALPSVLFNDYGAGVSQDYTFCTQDPNCVATDGGQEFVMDHTYASKYTTSAFYAFPVPGTTYAQGNVFSSAATYLTGHTSGTDLNTLSGFAGGHTALTDMWKGMQVKICAAGSGCTPSTYQSVQVTAVNSATDVTLSASVTTSTTNVLSIPALNGFAYRVITAGATGTTTPAWPATHAFSTTAAGGTVADGTTVIQNFGSGMTYTTNMVQPSTFRDANISNFNGVEVNGGQSQIIQNVEFGANVGLPIYNTGTATQIIGVKVNTTPTVGDPIAGIVNAGASLATFISGFVGSIGTTAPQIRSDMISAEGTSQGTASGRVLTPNGPLQATGLSAVNWNVLNTVVTLWGDPTGTTASSVNMQAALTSACNDGVNGSIFIPAGLWKLGPLSGYTGPCTIYGAGAATQIEPDNGITWTSNQCLFGQSSSGTGVTYRDFDILDMESITGGPVIAFCGTSETRTQIADVHLLSNNNNFQDLLDLDASTDLRVTNTYATNTRGAAFLETSVAGNSTDVFFDDKDTAVNTGVRSAGRTFTDGATATNFTLTSAAGAAFVSGDVGRPVTGTNIAPSTVIAAYVSATQVTLNNATTGTGSGLTITLGGLVTSAGDGFACTNSNSFNCSNVRMIGDFASNVSGVGFDVGGSGTSPNSNVTIQGDQATSSTGGNGCVLCANTNNCSIIGNICNELGFISTIVADIENAANNSNVKMGEISGNTINQPNGGFGSGIEIHSADSSHEVSDVPVLGNSVSLGTTPAGDPYVLDGFEANAVWANNFGIQGTQTNPCLSLNCSVAGCPDLTIQGNKCNNGTIGIFANNLLHGIVTANTNVLMTSEGIDVAGTNTASTFAPDYFFSDGANYAGGAIPTLGTCGTSATPPADPSNNLLGSATAGSGTTTCAVVFVPQMSMAPLQLNLIDETNTATVLGKTAVSATGFTVTGLTAGDKFSWSLPNSSN